MRKRIAGCILCLFPVLLLAAAGPPVIEAEEVADPAALVNPFVGTAGGGNTFPGPAVPFGMVQLSPDTGHNTGYSYDDSRIRGFSHTHLSGPGCSTHGDVLFTPTTGEPSSTDPKDYASGFDHFSEEASPGHYAVTLDRYDIRTELTATQRTGVHRYTFPQTDAANVLISIPKGIPSQVFDGWISVIDDRRVVGALTSGAFCGNPNRYTVYFSAIFDRPFESFATWKGSTVSKERRRTGPDVGARLLFDATEERSVEARVGISYVSVSGATQNLVREAGTLGFDEARRQAHKAWNGALSRVEIAGGTREQRGTFYTALYHALLHPNIFSDVDGRYRGFDDKVHVATGRTRYANFSLWDTYRGQHQLLALVMPDRARDMMASILAIYDEGGWLPKWAVNNGEANVMTGDPVTPVLVDAHLKGLLTGMEKKAYEALYANATSLPPEDTPFAGRAAIEDYERLGYVPNDPGHAGKPGSNDYNVGASATLEYALSDCAMSLMAADLGKDRDARYFADRSHNYRNLWDSSTGFFRPRLFDGSFMDAWDPAGQSGADGYEEDAAYQYLWLTPQDYGNLFDLLGGRKVAIDRLDDLFAYPQLIADLEGTARSVWNSDPQQFGGKRYNPNNEDDIEAPYVYDWAGAPDRTQTVVRAAETLYTMAPDGIPGNDDLGSMSAWYVLSALGMYPAAFGTDFYALTSPLFEEATVHLDRRYYDAERLVIEAPDASLDTRYVHGATLNGRRLDRAWVGHGEIRSGATLRFELRKTPSGRWAADPSGAPPAPCGESGRG